MVLNNTYNLIYLDSLINFGGQIEIVKMWIVGFGGGKESQSEGNSEDRNNGRLAEVEPKLPSSM